MHEGWQNFVETLRTGDLRRHFSKDELLRFKGFVAALPSQERVPLLIDAYRTYRGLGCVLAEDPERRFQQSCSSVLISTLVKARLKPTQDEACEILRLAFHMCGHGGDVDPPLEFAEQAFKDQAYSAELFEAVRAYRSSLQGLTSTGAQNAKRKINWILWHDVASPERNCYTRTIQESIAAMEQKEALQWQLLLRNTAPGFKPGKAWVKEAEKRLANVGREPFLSRIREWFHMPGKKVTLSPGGSQMLRLLASHGIFFPHEQVLPITLRLIGIEWTKAETAGKVMGALAAQLMEAHPHYPEQARLICERYKEFNADVASLFKLLNPGQASQLKQAQQRANHEVAAAAQASIASALDALRSRLRTEVETPMLEVLSRLAGASPRK